MNVGVRGGCPPSPLPAFKITPSALLIQSVIAEVYIDFFYVAYRCLFCNHFALIPILDAKKLLNSQGRIQRADPPAHFWKTNDNPYIFRRHFFSSKDDIDLTFTENVAFAATVFNFFPEF